MALQETAELPPLAQMLKQRLATELREYVDRVDSGLDEIAENEIDDAIFSTEGNRGFRTLASEAIEPGSFAAGERAQHAKV